MPLPKLGPSRAILGVAIGFALAGCNSAIINTAVYEGYVPGEWNGHDLTVTVIGDPFPGTAHGELGAATAEALQGTTFGGRTRFLAAPDAPAATYRVVVAIPPAPGVTGAALCRGGASPAAAPSAGQSRLEVLAAFCRGDRAISTVDGTIAREGSPHSATFRRCLAAFGYQLFPVQNMDLMELNAS